MNALIRIEDVELERTCYRDQPVLTLADIDRVHVRPEGTAYRNFNEHRDKFLFGADYFDLPYEEWSVLVPRNSLSETDESSAEKEAGGYRGHKIFMTMHGYLMLVKSFKDEKAWRVQRILVDSYFDLKVIQKAAQKDVEFTELQKKYIASLETNITLMGQNIQRKKVFSKVTEEEKQRRMELHAQGMTPSEISRHVYRSRSGISNIINYGMTAGIQGVRDQQAKQSQPAKQETKNEL